MKKRSAVTRHAFRAEVQEWSEKLGVVPRRVQVQRLTRKWASCSPEGRLTFSSDLLIEPKRFRSEVVVHELLHLIVPNHGRLFRSLLRAHLGGRATQSEARACMAHHSP